MRPPLYLIGTILATVVSLFPWQVAEVNAQSSSMSSNIGSEKPEEPTPTQPPTVPDVAQWRQNELNVDMRHGTMLDVQIEIDFAEVVNDVEVNITGDAEEITKITSVEVDQNGKFASITLEVSSEDGGKELVQGSIAAVVDGVEADSKLPLNINLSEFSEYDVPSSPTFPSPNRIGEQNGIYLVNDEIVVELADDVASPVSTIREIAVNTGSQITGSEGESRIFTLRREGENPESLNAYVDQVSAYAGVRFAYKNILVGSAEIEGNGWLYKNAQDDLMETIAAPEVWKRGNQGAGVTIAVVDNGVMLDHEDIRPTANPKGRAGYIGDHGTHVAGIACAIGNNNKGITGVAPECEVDSFLIETKQFQGENYAVAISSVSALKDAVKAQSERSDTGIINFSYGPRFRLNGVPLKEVCTDGMRESAHGGEAPLRKSGSITNGERIANLALEYPDILFVMSAGNDSTNVDCSYSFVGHKWDIPNVLSVGATNSNGTELADFSNFGEGVSVVAPGVDIMSTVPPAWGNGFSGYATDEGTSMAAPVVSGVAALMLAARPTASASDLAHCIVEGSRKSAGPYPFPSGSLSRDVRSSYPVVNASGSIDCIAATDVVPDEAFRRFLNEHEFKLPEENWNDPISARQMSTLTSIQLTNEIVHPVNFRWNLEGVQYAKNLEELAFDNVSYIPDVSHLPRLEVLRIKGFAPSTFPSAAGNYPSLVSFGIHGAPNLTSLPENIGSAHKLWEVQIGSTRITTLPSDLMRDLWLSPGFEILEISWNDELQSLPSSIGELSSLKRLSISENTALTSLPEELGELENLEYFWLHGNDSLVSLPGSIGKLENLKHLYAGENESLVSLPESFGNLKKLEVLGLDYNPMLHSLPESFGGLESLQELGLSQTAIADFPASMSSLDNLRSINAHSAGWETMPSWIFDLESLESIDVTGNPLVHQDQEQITNLRETGVKVTALW